MGLSAPWENSLDIIALHPLKEYEGLVQYTLVTLGTTLIYIAGYYQNILTTKP